MKSIGFKEGEWHHIVMTWSGFDSGRRDARAALYIDGELAGELKDRDIAMRWQTEHTGIYVAVSLIGLLDELVVFDRPLSRSEIDRLRREPGLLASLSGRSGAPGDVESRAGSDFPPPDSEGGWRRAATPEEIRRVAGIDASRLDAAFESPAAERRTAGSSSCETGGSSTSATSAGDTARRRLTVR